MTLLQQIEGLLRQLDISDKYAKEEKPKDDRLPSVWEIQNSHIRDGLKAIQQQIAERAANQGQNKVGIEVARQIISSLIGRAYLFNENEELVYKVAIELTPLLSFLSRMRLPEPIVSPETGLPHRQEFFLCNGQYAFCEILIDFDPNLPNRQQWKLVRNPADNRVFVVNRAYGTWSEIA